MMIKKICDRDVQKHREGLVEKLAAYHQEQSSNEEELISKAAAEAEARQDKQQHEKDEKKAAMLKSIAEHREAVVSFISEDTLNLKWFLLLGYVSDFCLKLQLQ